MSNFQVLHYHFTVNPREISFLQVNEKNALIPEKENLKRFQALFDKEINDRLKLLITFLKAKNEALVYFSTPFLTFLEQTDLTTLNAIKKYVSTCQIKLVGSCAYHSFSYLCHPLLFEKEVALHQNSYKQFFDQSAAIFINTACIFDDDLITHLAKSNFDTIIATANSWHLSGVHTATAYQSTGDRPLKILLSNGDSSSSSYLSLANGYGSAYDNREFVNSSLKSLDEFMQPKKDTSTYSASMPLSSPEWQYPISNYIGNPLQKALFAECKRLVEAYSEQLTDEDWQTIMIICQPEKLIDISKASQSTSYQTFINDMNILTAIGLNI